MNFDAALNAALDYLGWTHGDFGEFVRQVLLYSVGLWLWVRKPARFTAWRYFGTIALMTANLGVARVALGLDVHSAWIICTMAQATFAAILFITAETWAGMTVGALFGVMIAGAGLTVWGVVSPFPSIGLTMNYWSVMSVASYAQDATMLIFAATFARKRLWISSRHG